MKTFIIISLTGLLLIAYGYEFTQLSPSSTVTQKVANMLTLRSLRDTVSNDNTTTPASATPSATLTPTDAPTVTPSENPTSPSPTYRPDSNNGSTDVNINTNSSGTSKSCYKVTINGETFEECSGGGSLKFNYSN